MMLKTQIKRGVATASRWIWQTRTGQSLKYLFLLGHMRAYSSVLSHVLGSHREILGYKENHIVYDNLDSLNTLISTSLRESPNGLHRPIRYVFDKILHSSLMPNLEIFPPTQTVILIVVRQPAEALTSMVSHLEGWDMPTAVDYYCSRLSDIRRYVDFFQSISIPIMIMRAESILNQKSEVLAILGEFLELASPLSDKYKSFEKTGVPGAGDSTPLLASGYIMNQSKYSGVSVPVPREASNAYENFFQSVANWQARANLKLVNLHG